jgi:mannose/fructose/N-acetylgalactosamine-specific phosphotransferase system component IIC
VIGSYGAVRMPEAALRAMLATILIVVAGKIASKELSLPLSKAMTFARSVGH